MLLSTVLASVLLLCTVASQECFSFMGISDVRYLIDKVQKQPPSSCSCSANVTDCLCLPIPSDNCTTPCFQEGLSQLINSTVGARYLLIFNRVKRTVQDLKNKCKYFSCEQPCNQTTTGNTLMFLRSLQEIFQKKKGVTV
ncbi:interleukin-9 [Canis lupus baileyi]|uniref:Interleukin 9 n=2 Tax=Canis lupus familiaris TaxID=9615 RepID=A0A8C0YU50_CANLF|nr:interleukin-9 [Canis lupus familiaris]XP_025289025.1 interleukin-9 [Canis lupus dingo]XP_038407587.1 interleukin-9 [Canis lupus familiaris]XP_038536977.1 interleukin-9 [Canis lupus familiaris]|eukprot:XP_003431641.1 interleukin-9 [Canis lupus familiaris]